MKSWGRRFAAALFGATLLGLLTQCHLKPKAGGKCSNPGQYVCSDLADALLCTGGTFAPMPCRGPKGCQGSGAQSQCDDDLAQAGDACQTTLNENYACGTDHKEELLCKDGTFAAVRSCKGPKACTIEGDTIHCDDSLADVGDPCVEEPGDANYACSSDRSTEVVCKAGKFGASNSCRGTKGCFVNGDNVHCDASFAREGEICRPVDNHACGEDAKSEMQCSPQMKWIKKRDCKRVGCKVKGNEIYCD